MKIEQKKIVIFFLTVLIFFIKNLFPTLSFSNKTAIINLQDSNSDFVINPSSLNLDASFKNGFNIPAGQTIVLNTRVPVSGLLDLSGTLSLDSDLYCETGLTYSGIGTLSGNGNSVHLGGNLIIPSNNILHIGSNTAIEGHGNTIILGDSAALFIDDNVTLTLRNVTINNTKNFAGYPAINLGSNRSKLALDNATLDIIGDFYFNYGQLFIHNDVTFTGTNAFVYYSPMPSFITSGATLNFDVGTTFSIAPATFTDCPYSTIPTTTTNNFILMADQTSQLYLNGCNLCTTFTGCRFTKGSLFFDNRVTIKSNAANTLLSINPTPISTSAGVSYLAWSPDGKYIAIVASGIKIYRFTGSALSLLFSTSDGWGSDIAWSPDGKFIAYARDSSGATLMVYPFTQYGLGKPFTVGTGYSGPRTVFWSTDGKFVALANNAAGGPLFVYPFTGNGFGTAMTASTGSGFPWVGEWSPDGKFIALPNYSGTPGIINVFPFNGTSIGTPITKITGTNPGSATDLWSPDGRFIAICNENDNSLMVISFTGTGFGPAITSTSGLNYPMTASWSMDGRYIAVGNRNGNTLQVFPFTGKSLGTPLSVATDNAPRFIAWSPDGNYIAEGNGSTLQVFKLNYGVDRSTQALSNSIVFGNAARGSTYDLNVRGLSGAKIEIDGLLNYDNVN